ncbi:MAG: glycerol-3-phosphate 1-O-acyltransferase PlsY [Deltaproteobacteria bacterium]|nr:glycerol-3-phosphate 1-O-acyltransferase PlsY [Deltaproteobacteria bacterium]
MIMIKYALPVLAYLLGSVPFGAAFFRFRHDMDIRALGSGNIGATNVMRNAGPAMGLITLGADMAKGWVLIFVARHMGAGDLIVALTGLAAFLGHIYPVWTDFKGGGKGVATAGGCLAAWTPLGFLWVLLVFIAGLFVTGRVSVGSLCAALVLPVVAFAFTGMVPVGIVATAMTIMIFRRHSANVARIKEGTEPRVFGGII